MSDTLLAYHFLNGDKLRDGSPAPPDGETLHWRGALEMCHSGLHASVSVLNALRYAPGSTLCLVRCGGELVRVEDKLVCRERTILRRADATAMLRRYARECARDVLHLWDAPQVVREYLTTGDESLRAAAWDAARAAAWETQRQRLARLATALLMTGAK